MADKDFRVKQGIVVGGDAFISNSITSVNSISFVDTQEFEPGRGSLAWSNTEGTLSLGLTDTVKLQVGQEAHYYALNQSGSTILNNTVVMATGTVGNSGAILISPAVGDGTFPSKYVMGVATQDILDGDQGYITAFGKVRGIDTSMFSEGDILYLDPANPGAMMNTAPVAPNNAVTVAIVVTKHENVGEIFVRPTFTDRLAGLEDVHTVSISDGQSLVWVSANSRFENQTISGGGAGDEANLYNTYTTLAANDYNSYTTLTANTYNTLLATQANDYSTLLTAQANDYNSYTTLTANTYNTLLAAQSNDGVTLASAQANDGVTLAIARANDYNSYTTLTANDYNTLLTAQANDYNSYTTLTANIYNTLLTAQANDGVTLLTAQANDYSTYTTLVGLINTVQDNVSSSNAVLFSDSFSVDGSTNAFTLSSNAIQNTDYLLVYLGGLLQHSDSYTISNNILTISNTDPLPTTSLAVRALNGGGYSGLSDNVIDLLIVAGGGSGAGAAAASVGGGGGAGGLIYKTNFQITPGITYNIVVGAGGAVTSAAQVNGNPGANSSAFGFVAIGGGYGGTFDQAGGPGGSGGGGGGRDLYTVNNFGGPGTSEQGHAGGNATRGTATTDDSGGGGGGAGSPGRSARDEMGGDGGDGFACTIEGFTTTTYYAGGGGGGTEDGIVGASGGAGGGGDGGYLGGNRRGGTENTGGGGGGASGSSTLTGGAGGSGVVIVRTILTATANTGSPSVNTVGSYNIYKFTGSGSITF